MESHAVLLCVRLLRLSIMFSFLIRVACISSPFLFIAEQCSVIKVLYSLGFLQVFCVVPFLAVDFVFVICFSY